MNAFDRLKDFSVAQTVKNLSTMQETWVRSLGQEDPLEKWMANHSSILVWRIPWTEKPGGLQSMGLQRAGQDWSDWACVHVSDTRFHIQMMSYSVCLSDSLHSVWRCLVASILLHTALFHSFLWLNSIPLYICTTSSLFQGLIFKCSINTVGFGVDPAFKIQALPPSQVTKSKLLALSLFSLLWKIG